MKIKKLKVKNMYLIIIFVSISFFCSLGFGTIQSIIIDNKGNGIANKQQSIHFSLDSDKKISNKEFINTIKEIDKVYIQKLDLRYGKYDGMAIYFNYQNNYHSNMLSGSFFKKDDFLDGKPKAVIGKDVTKNVEIDENNNKFFEYEGIKYQVIGIMGYNDRKSAYDNQFVLNLDSYLSNMNILPNISGMVIDSDDNFTLLNNSIKEKTSESRLIKDNNSEVYINTAIDIETVAKALGILCLLIFLNVFNITFQWIYKKRKEIGIKKALGAPEYKIAFEIILENQKVAIISFAAGYLLYVIIIKSNILAVLGANIYIISTILTLLFVMIISLITSIVSIIKAFKIEPAIIMKGGK